MFFQAHYLLAKLAFQYRYEPIIEQTGIPMKIVRNFDEGYHLCCLKQKISKQQQTNFPLFIGLGVLFLHPLFKAQLEISDIEPQVNA